MPLKPVPRMRQFNKLWGLKKLREITKHTPGAATFAEFKVYATPEQFRLRHARGKPRLLIRGDEKGKEYRTTNWDTIPRSEVSTSKLSEEEIKNHLKQIAKERLIVKKHGKTPEDELFSRRARFVVHTTRDRGDVAFAGNLRLAYFGNRPAVLLELGFGNEAFTSRLPVGVFLWKEGKLVLTDQASSKFYKQYFKSAKPKAILQNLEIFINEGVTRKQLRFGRRYNSILRFNTWNDSPTIPEFYDLREFRDSFENTKKKRGS